MRRRGKDIHTYIDILRAGDQRYSTANLSTVTKVTLLPVKYITHEYKEGRVALDAIAVSSEIISESIESLSGGLDEAVCLAKQRADIRRSKYSI